MSGTNAFPNAVPDHSKLTMDTAYGKIDISHLAASSGTNTGLIFLSSKVTSNILLRPVSRWLPGYPVSSHFLIISINVRTCPNPVQMSYPIALCKQFRGYTLSEQVHNSSH
ncbi:hypothetical protein PtA15_10A100 [Puccinia triticina]|uniref:Uncharacterized protein n=1 Tax=Puccinia triticina TaxID=208348 RepID=A0ABY7CTV7_9BASI|nr:uncharacterized protein PtA15_10A100 [Puccinia triticina]WAQ88681.1 hypothetical protein PtA15_10A100 [Puccinia triticina]